MTTRVPVPVAGWSGVTEPYFEVVPYSKWNVVSAPRGSSEPTRVVVSATVPFAAPVDTPGARGGASVVSEWSAPRVTPAAFVATTR